MSRTAATLLTRHCCEVQLLQLQRCCCCCPLLLLLLLVLLLLLPLSLLPLPLLPLPQQLHRTRCSAQTAICTQGTCQYACADIGPVLTV
jgi:hypothetical protein